MSLVRIHECSASFEAKHSLKTNATEKKTDHEICSHDPPKWVENDGSVYDNFIMTGNAQQTT